MLNKNKSITYKFCGCRGISGPLFRNTVGMFDENISSSVKLKEKKEYLKIRFVILKYRIQNIK